MPEIERLADSIELIVVGAVGLTARALVEAAPDVELTLTQWRALTVVAESPAGVRIGKVAERVAITSPAAGRLLRRLDRRGLITLTTDDQDRRATIARLTPLGERTRADIVRYRRRALRSLASGLPPTEHGDLARSASVIAAGFEPFS